MHITPYCTACISMRRAAELEALPIDNSEKLAIYRQLLDAVNLYITPDTEVVELATVSFRRLKALVKQSTPYEQLIEQNLSKAVARAKSIEDLIAGKPIDERLSLALRAASLATGYRAFNTPDKILEEPPSTVDLTALGTSLQVGRDDTRRVVRLLHDLQRNGGTIYYLFGSVFELPYDAILLRILVNDLGLSVAGITRSDRYEDYVVTEDLESIGIADTLSEVIDLGSDDVTVTIDSNEHLYEQLNNASLVVVKGELQATYFHNNPVEAPMLFLFAVPCPVIARAFNLPPRSFNIVLQEKPRQG
ncbi:hypothetical protein CF15_04060 [Pyrodictium occultum]|uniref:Damage-control phosphatase ARMT1-like metal-binding domain-containing protein n=1 Tax=Pyrodictium occultum TaxID=2309 RepID=A0A0V8RV92_PYROC|nr:hypothetical protein CF15_04060 [Pyrodictium occultum]